mgnify:CR=1 FL=1
MTTYDHAAEARMLREESARRRAENPPHYVVEGTGGRFKRYAVHVEAFGCRRPRDWIGISGHAFAAVWFRFTLAGAHRCGARQLAKYLREREAREFREVGL